MSSMSTRTEPGMMITPKEEGSGVLTWQWLGGLLVSLVMGIGAYSFTDLKARVMAQEARIQGFELSENNLRNEISNVRSAQERDHKLIVQIARKMGIEVAE